MSRNINFFLNFNYLCKGKIDFKLYNLYIILLRSCKYLIVYCCYGLFNRRIKKIILIVECYFFFL